jgi:hypothetical protein
VEGGEGVGRCMGWSGGERGADTVKNGLGGQH